MDKNNLGKLNEQARKANAEMDVLLRESYRIIGALAADYEGVNYVELSEDKADDIGIGYRTSELLKKLAPGSDVSISFSEKMHILAKAVYGPDKEMFLHDTRREHVLGKLEDADSFSIFPRFLIDNEIRYYEMKFSAVRENDRLVGIVAGLRSIDEQRKKELEIQQELREALVAADAANRAKTAFLFNMTHDIRTPMNAVLGFMDMALKYIDDREKASEYLAKAQQSGNNLLTLINEVLDFSRIESGDTEIAENPGDIYYSFANIRDSMRTLALEKGITLSFEFGEITDRFVYVDFSRCIRILSNLITNAINYTENGGYVKVRCEQVSPKRDGKAVYKYTVEDNGIGMTEDYQKHMYDAFTREQSSTMSGIHGTGVGLSVCKTFVEQLGGTINCQSTKGKGTVFTVMLPLKIQEGKAYTDPDTGRIHYLETGENKTADFSGKRVLLVEDNELNREIARDVLEEKGLSVDEAEDGSIAVEIMLEKGPDYYDFILMDIQMPVMNGYDATKAIRKMYPDRNIPIIAVSANAFNEDRQASREAGMNDHVAKPIDVNVLFSTLARFL